MLTLHGITRAFEGQTVLSGVDLTVATGTILCLLGASGSGKSTLLRIVAGLERADAGDVRVDGISVLKQPPHARDFGLMFQDYALFPHMNALANVAFGLRMHGVAADQRRERALTMLRLVGMETFAARDISGLSGGEKQRIALARSLAPSPRLLMLDEPLGSLDAALRDQLVVEVRAIIKAAGLTAIYVTHDQREAFAIADQIALLRAGKVAQVGAPRDLYRHPHSAYAARFLGFENIIPVLNAENGSAHTALGVFMVDRPAPQVLLHPAGFRIDPVGSIHAQVEAVVFQGDYQRVEVLTDAGIRLVFPLFGADVRAGDQVRLSIAPDYVVPLAD